MRSNAGSFFFIVIDDCRNSYFHWVVFDRTSYEEFMKVIVFTTQYRKGGELFFRTARTLEAYLKSTDPEEVLCVPTETKQELRQIFWEIEESGRDITEFYFIGHSGMYGPMFGTIRYPEQFSPWEWQNIRIPFAHNAKACFYCCRSARWFAPFFAATQKVRTGGFYWYTTFSASPLRYKAVDRFAKSANVYSIECPGKKSHGLPGSLKKLLGLTPAEEMKFFDPPTQSGDSTYNRVAALYADVFADIKVRENEWNWIKSHLPDKPPRVLDIGCGNGALLDELSASIVQGIGLDESDQMIQAARSRRSGKTNLSFLQMEGPRIPLEDKSVDVVISLLSFRYLDWDPVMEEIARVLTPGGRLLLVDMVSAPVRLKEYPRMLLDKVRVYHQRKRNPDFYKALNVLVSDPAWKEMLKHNPIRARHEYVWYLESRFPGRKTETLNIGFHSRILAFDSGDISNYKALKLTYP
jgi:ubiquinone/menaquinone biosynthesis C-methylase UbiE